MGTSSKSSLSHHTPSKIGSRSAKTPGQGRIKQWIKIEQRSRRLSAWVATYAKEFRKYGKGTAQILKSEIYSRWRKVRVPNERIFMRPWGMVRFPETDRLETPSGGRLSQLKEQEEAKAKKAGRPVVPKGREESRLPGWKTSGQILEMLQSSAGR
jgi:hypothetical protein